MCRRLPVADFSRAACGGHLLSLEQKGRRFDILVEGIGGARKSALRIGTVVEFHRDVELTRSAAATPPLDHALSRVRVAAYDLVGPVASCRVKAAAAAGSSFSGTTCVAIPS